MDDRLRAIAAQQGGVFTRSDALACGLTDEVLARRVRVGDITRLRPGVFAEASSTPDGDCFERHVLALAAARAACQRELWASHESAVLLHGGRVFGASPLARLTARVGRPVRGRDGRIDVAAVPPEHVHRQLIRGVPVVTAARAVIDVARSSGVRAAVVAADSLLHLGKLNRRQLEAALRDCTGWPGSLDACRAVRLADKRSESALESVSRVVMDDHGIEMPEPQVWIELSDHPPVRVDFYWKRYRLIGEADGKVKYDLKRDPDALYKERIRHEWLDDDDFTIVRWRWLHVEGDGLPLAQRLLGAIEKAQRRAA